MKRNNNTRITCPSCNSEFDLQDSIRETLYKDLELQINAKNESRIREMENKVRIQISNELSGELESYKEQLALKVKEAKELRRISAEYEKIKREKEELKETLVVEFEKSYNEKLNEEKLKLRQQTDNKYMLQVSDKEMVINQLKDQLTIAQQKINQGSVQTQGESFELMVESYLQNSFPGDIVEEIKKGVRGTDCILNVNSDLNESCGLIFIECKRAKTFQASWVDKMLDDIRGKSAAFGIIISDVYPKGVERISQIRGIWVCSFEEFKGLIHVLRECVLQLHQVKVSNENQGGKLELLYKFLTGSEFKANIEAIVEGFTTMEADLIKEKRSMEGLWKARQKQIEKVILNTTHLFGSIKGIAGKAVHNIKKLEL